MRILGVFLSILSLSTALLAQEKQSVTSLLAQKGILNHMDVGVTAGTMGIGIDLAVPVGDYVRIRAGYSYMPRFTINSNFRVETSNGSFGETTLQTFNANKDKLAAILNEPPFDQPKYQKYKEIFGKISDMELHDYVTMGLQPNMHQFKFLVDVMPFKNNKHWSFTTGFFVGPSNIGSACNAEKETTTLEGILAYNELYKEVCKQEFPVDEIYINIAGTNTELLGIMKSSGVAGFPLGYFENGDKAMMVPAPNATVRAEMEISKFRPYIGFGYNTHLSHNKKWNLNVDAGVVFLCGKPKIYVDNVYKINVASIDTQNYVYDIVRPNDEMTDFVVDDPLSHIDLARDLHDIPGKVGNMTRTISKLKVYPNVSVTFSYRLY